MERERRRDVVEPKQTINMSLKIFYYHQWGSHELFFSLSLLLNTTMRMAKTEFKLSAVCPLSTVGEFKFSLSLPHFIRSLRSSSYNLWYFNNIIFVNKPFNIQSYDEKNLLMCVCVVRWDERDVYLNHILWQMETIEFKIFSQLNFVDVYSLITSIESRKKKSQIFMTFLQPNDDKRRECFTLNRPWPMIQILWLLNGL